MKIIHSACLAGFAKKCCYYL